MIPAITIFLCYALLSPIAALLGFPWTWITGDITFLYRFSMWIAATGVRMASIRVHAEGLENVPSGQPCIFMANHVSNLDPPVLLPEVPGRTAVFVKSELMKIPFIGMGMRMGGFVPVERSGNREDARESIERAAKVLASGVHLTAFPEGTRSRTGKMLPFKKGPFYLAQQTGAPIIPVSIYGTETMMRKGSLKIFPGVAHIHLHPPLFAADFSTREELMHAVRDSIAAGLPEWMRG
ncbi:MAG TPA: lysophospholipid acyltransferase family protein [Acidobacteriaceae bacterium]|nr:lysophospholipid acyltransferase family protein [Acidobacteriaceae bacterium]